MRSPSNPQALEIFKRLNYGPCHSVEHSLYFTLWFYNSKELGQYFQYIKNLHCLGGSSLFSYCLGYHIPIPIRGHECQHLTQRLEVFGEELTRLPGILLTEPVPSASILIFLRLGRDAIPAPQHVALLLCLDFVTSSLFQRSETILPPSLPPFKPQPLFQLNLQDRV